ncbi:MAG TPA: hypothetical protein VGC89_12865 [Pyrinomonadaceae bacterium]|jgi:hypothetical protein
MLKKLLTSMLWAILSISLPVVATAQSNERTKYVVDYSQTDRLSITMHRNGGCESVVLDPTRNVSFTTGDTFAICFKPSFAAHIYIINESAEGTYIAYPESASQLGPVSTQQSYGFALVGEPGPETLTFFVAKEPIAQLDDLIRRGQLQLSSERLFQGKGVETIGSDTGAKITNTAHGGSAPAKTGAKVKLKEFLRQTLGLFRPIAFQWLDVFFDRLLAKSTVAPSRPFTLERARFDADLTNTLNARPKPDDNNIARLLSGKAMVLQLSYQHVGRQ